MSVTLVLIIILLLSIGILIKLICDNKSSEIEKFLNQLKLLTTSNLIVWTKQEHDFYDYKVIVYHTVTKIGSFAIKIHRDHDNELQLPIFDKIYIIKPFNQQYEINIQKTANIVLMEKCQNLIQLIETQLKHTIDGESNS